MLMRHSIKLKKYNGIRRIKMATSSRPTSLNLIIIISMPFDVLEEDEEKRRRGRTIG